MRRAPISIAIVVSAICVLMPASASASRIDNDSDRPVSFWFSCGVACGNYFDDVPSGDWVARPGIKGDLEAGVFTKELNWICMAHSKDVVELRERIVTVEAHGEVAVKYSSKDKTFTWFNKGGNPELDYWGRPIWPIVRSSRHADHRCWYGTP